MKDTLATLPNANDVLVWARHLPDWKRARDVPELKPRVIVPPLLPARSAASEIRNDDPNEWTVKWWWVIVALLFLGSVGSQIGRREMGRVSAERRASRASNQKPRGLIDYIPRYRRGELSLPGAPTMTKGEKIYLIVMLLGPFVVLGVAFMIYAAANPRDFVRAPEHGFGYAQLMLMALVAGAREVP